MQLLLPRVLLAAVVATDAVNPAPQLTFLEDQLPYLIPAAREALRGMDRKPISDLVA
jgi:hypothetical protein